MTPEHLPQYIATNNVKPMQGGGSIKNSIGGAGWPIDKHGRQLTNAEVELMNGKGGDGC
jgi:hypothetical protein